VPALDNNDMVEGRSVNIQPIGVAAVSGGGCDNPQLREGFVEAKREG